MLMPFYEYHITYQKRSDVTNQMSGNMYIHCQPISLSKKNTSRPQYSRASALLVRWHVVGISWVHAKPREGNVMTYIQLCCANITNRAKWPAKTAGVRQNKH
eukprot:scaffold108752_cov17-Prasinocladus_malaysianus.AAC.2